MTSSDSPPEALGPSHSFRTWSQAQSLNDSLARAEASVRAQPRDPAARWLLFELLCVLGRWERALKQLQVWAGTVAGSDSTAQVMRGLIRAELQRIEVLAGRAEPATISAAPASVPEWIAGLSAALHEAAPGGTGVDAADARRGAALEQVADTPGASNVVPTFEWIADSDSRLGPVCEVILAGAYRWLAFQDLTSVSKAAPKTLLDLVWSPVDLLLRDHTPLKCFMPMRYPVRDGDRDALLLGRETVWHEVGRTGVHGRGQKTWITDAADLSLLDLRECRFGPATAAASATPSTAEASDDAV